jgi:hypothetical protein
MSAILVLAFISGFLPMFLHNSFSVRSFVHPLAILASLKRVGAYHIERHTPCEDFSDFAVLEKSGLVVAIVADGLGSTDCPLARFGSQQSSLYIIKCLFKEEHRNNGLTLEQAENVVSRQSQDVINRFVRLKKVWLANETGDGSSVNDVPFFRGMFGTTLLVLIASKSGSTLLHVGDGILMANNHNGAQKWNFVEAESAHSNNTTRELMTFPLLKTSFGKESFLTLCTDGLEKLLPFERWNYSSAEETMRVLQQDVTDKASAHMLCSDISININSLLLSSPVAAQFDSDDGALVQLALQKSASKKESKTSPAAKNERGVSNLGVDYHSQHLLFFGSRSLDSFSHSVTVEFLEGNVSCSVVAFYEIAGVQEPSVQVSGNTESMSPQGVVFDILDHGVYNLLLESGLGVGGNSKAERIGSTQIFSALNRLEGFLKRKSLESDGWSLDGWSIGVIFQSDCGLQALLSGSVLLMAKDENSSVELSPAYSDRRPKIVQLDAQSSFCCSFLNNQKRASCLLGLVEEPLCEVTNTLIAMKTTLTRGAEAFVVGRVIKAEDSIGEWSNPGLKAYLQEEYFGVCSSGKDSRRAFANRLTICKNLPLHQFFVDLGLPNPLTYTPKESISEADQQSVTNSIFGQGMIEKEQEPLSPNFEDDKGEKHPKTTAEGAVQEGDSDSPGVLCYDYFNPKSQKSLWWKWGEFVTVIKDAFQRN